MIDSAMWSNENFAALPAMARLLQVGVINMADDQGRVKAFPAYLRSQIFPYDDVAIADIAKWLRLIAQNGTIEIYQADGKEYIQLLNWWEYQSLQYPAPSEYPAPQGWRDRIRYNAKGGAVLTFNYVTIKGERMPDTCDSRGNPLGYSVGRPPETPVEPPVDEQPSAPADNPPGLSTWDTHLDTPPETPAGPPNTIQDQLENKTDQPNQGDDDEDAQARDPRHQLWMETYGAEMPPEIEKRIKSDLAECPEEAILHAIRASANSNERTFGYLKKCALNYVPPPLTPENTNYTKNGNGRYSVDIPGVVAMPAAPKAAAPPLPPPMQTSDPWQMALAEILPVLPPHAAAWLKESACRECGELVGFPLYRVYANTEPGNVGWLEDRAAPLIRKTLSSILRKRIEVDIVAAEKEPVQ